MSVLVTVIAVVFLLSLVGGGAMVMFLRSKSEDRSDQSSPSETAVATSDAAFVPAEAIPTFHWRYLALPLSVFVLSLALVGYFYRLLPAEVAYHFRPDGSPDGWLGRGAIALWALLPQLFLSMLAGTVTWGISKLGAAITEAGTGMARLDRILFAMGNMVAIPQLIIFFAMLDAFSYNAYQIRILPLWAFAVIVTVVGAVVLAVFFYRAMRRA